MPIEVEALEFSVCVSDAPEPLWKNDIERWYQLDLASYALAETSFLLKSRGSLSPDSIILGVSGGSNQADLEFLKTNCTSPSKFVYTLPNVPLAAVCQVLGWQGQTRCITCRENDLDIVLKEATDLATYEQKFVLVFWIDQKVADTHKKIKVFLLNQRMGQELDR